MRISDWSSDVCSSDLGGRVYVDVRSTGEVTFHEGYLYAKEARRAARGDGPEPAKLARPEVTSTMQTYLDLHRHAAVRAALPGPPGIALRLMVAHPIGGSHSLRGLPGAAHAATHAVPGDAGVRSDMSAGGEGEG